MNKVLMLTFALLSLSSSVMGQMRIWAGYDTSPNNVILRLEKVPNGSGTVFHVHLGYDSTSSSVVFSIQNKKIYPRFEQGYSGRQIAYVTESHQIYRGYGSTPMDHVANIRGKWVFMGYTDTSAVATTEDGSDEAGLAAAAFLILGPRNKRSPE